jgi:hypothetical protein
MAEFKNLTPRQRLDRRVTWKDGYKPVAFPGTEGVVFTSNSQATTVRFDGMERLAVVSTEALRLL